MTDTPFNPIVSRETPPPSGKRALRHKGRMAAQADIKQAIEKLLSKAHQHAAWNEHFHDAYTRELQGQLTRI